MEIDINMQRTSCEHEGRDQGATLTSKGTAKIASKPPAPWTQTGQTSPGCLRRAQDRNGPTDTENQLTIAKGEKG